MVFLILILKYETKFIANVTLGDTAAIRVDFHGSTSANVSISVREQRHARAIYPLRSYSEKILAKMNTFLSFEITGKHNIFIVIANKT